MRRKFLLINSFCTYRIGVSLTGASLSAVQPHRSGDRSDGSYAETISSLNVAPDVGSRITLLLKRIVAGSKDVFVSPLLGERDPEAILFGLDEIFERGKTKLNPELVSIEVESNRSKFGPMSWAQPWDERNDTLYDSFKPPTSSKVFTPYPLDVRARLRPLSVPKTIGYLKNYSNSGLSDMTKKKNVKEKYKGWTLDDLVNVVRDSMITASNVLACLLFTRTQELGKTRNVWGYPIVATILEMCFYRPLLEIQSKQTWRSALRRPEDVSRAITKLIDICLAEQLKLISIDFSRFDNSVKWPLINAAFATIKLSFQEKFHWYLDVIRDFMIMCPIVTPDGVLRGEHGIPSGSTFTNEVDSIVQFGVSLECKDILYYYLSQVQGDDGVYLSRFPEAVLDHFRSFGLIVNDEKSYIASNWVVYLQMLFHSDYRDESGVINGIYPIYRALNRICYLERFEDFSEYGIAGNDYFAIRTISILENCKYHPLFEEFVEYVWSLDKYGLKMSDQGIARYVEMLAMQEGKDITFRNWSYGSDTSGIKSFSSVKVINKLNSRV